MEDFTHVQEIQNVVKGMLRSDDEAIKIIEDRLTFKVAKELKEALEILDELVDIFDGVRLGKLGIDSFTLQPAKVFLEKHKS